MIKIVLYGVFLHIHSRGEWLEVGIVIIFVEEEVYSTSSLKYMRCDLRIMVLIEEHLI